MKRCKNDKNKYFVIVVRNTKSSSSVETRKHIKEIKNRWKIMDIVVIL